MAASAEGAEVSAEGDQAAAGEEASMNIFVKTYFSKPDRARIAEKISELERATSGEVRVSVVHRRRWSERGLTLEELAHRDFYRLGMEKTKNATGVLLFLFLGERKFQIVADRGINDRVPQETWDTIAQALTSFFKEERYLEGMLEALTRIGAVLHDHFPRQSDDAEELSNNVDIRS